MIVGDISNEKKYLPYLSYHISVYIYKTTQEYNIIFKLYLSQSDYAFSTQVQVRLLVGETISGMCFLERLLVACASEWPSMSSWPKSPRGESPRSLPGENLLPQNVVSIIN